MIYCELLFLHFLGGYLMKRIKNEKFCIFVLLISFILSVLGTNLIGLAESIDDSPNIDVLFVVDGSKSMTKSDPDKLSGEAMKMFLDMCHIKGDKGAMVAYSGGIIKETNLKVLNSNEDKDKLKDTLSNLELGNWTDIGLGLRRAVEIMKDGHDKKNKPIIILLSDGKADPQRDKQTSQDDLSAALNEAKAQSFPIYTIGLNADGTVDNNQLQFISNETRGKNFITSSANDLPSILKSIFADNSRLKVQQENTLTGTGEFENVNINIPDSNIVEANISILSKDPVEVKLADPSGKEVQIPSDKVIYTKSNKYSMVKLLSPAKGQWTLKIKGSKDNKIDISLVSNYDLKVVMNVNSGKKAHKGEKVNITSFLESNGVKLEDKDFYTTLKALLLVRNTENNEVKEIPMVFDKNQYTAEYALPDEKTYELKVRIEGPGFIRESATAVLGAENRAPVVSKKLGKKTLWNKKGVTFNLNDYFKDADKDKLTFTASTSSLDKLNVKVDKDKLTISARKWGKETVTVFADDGKGGKVSAELNVKNYLIVYILIGLLALIIIIPALVILLKVLKTSKAPAVGQMSVQIRDNVTGSVKSPQYKPLKHFKGKFSLHNLLNLSPEYAETSKINLIGGPSDTLILTNKSQCTIELHGRKVDAAKGITIRHNDQINVVLTLRNEIIYLQYFNR